MKLLRSPRLLFSLGLLLPMAVVAFAVTLTVFYLIAACPLCIVQRLLYLLIALASLAGLFARQQLMARLCASVMTLSAATGAAIAGYQIYLQKHPFSATCGDGTAWWERLVEQAGQALPVLFKADGLCSDSTWALFGLSIVEWSLVTFAALFVIGILVFLSRPSR